MNIAWKYKIIGIKGILYLGDKVGPVIAQKYIIIKNAKIAKIILDLAR